MSLDIISRTIGGELDKKFVLRNHQCARLMSIQDNWTRLRIGCRFAFVDTGGDLAGTPRFWIGVLSSPSVGLQNGPLSAATSHFVGIRSNSPTVARFAGPPPFYAIGTQILKRVVSTNTAGTGGTGGVNVWADPNNRRHPIIVELEKGSPWTVRTVGCNNASGVADIPYDSMVEAMEAETMAGAELVLESVGGASYFNTFGTIAVDEGTDGALNAVCMAWDRSTIQLEWSELLFAKFA